MDLLKVALKKNEDIRIKSGHLWVFSNEIAKADAGLQNGDLAAVVDHKNEYMGCGFYNKNSLIAVRMLTNKREYDIKEILRDKLLAAKKLRDALYGDRSSYRLAFSESDFLPGLIIDRYNNTYVLQIYSYGMAANINTVAEILKEDFGAENIFTKNEEYFRKLEGLPVEDAVFYGEPKPEVIEELGVKYAIDFNNAHKTGFYFDQTDNRVFTEKISKGATVLDAFCNSGGFGLHTAKAGAENITFVDSSASEIEKAKNNFQLNEFKQEAVFEVADVFDYFEKCIAVKKKFGVVVIDPPAFAKNKKSLPIAKKGYERINRLALETVEPGGWLVSSSCSHHLTEADFIIAITKAAVKAGRTIQLVHFNNASLDHPKLPSMPETTYLKFAVIRALN